MAETEKERDEAIQEIQRLGKSLDPATKRAEMAYYNLAKATLDLERTRAALQAATDHSMRLEEAMAKAVNQIETGH